MSSIIVLGSINTDLVVKSDRLPKPGETVLGSEFFEADGGKGANQAVAAARLSREPVTFIAAVGDDAFGRHSLEGLARENLCQDYIRTVPDCPSGVAMIMVDANGENCISVASGANGCLSADDVDAVPDEVFASAKVFLACLESPLEAVMRGLRRAKDHGTLTILNPAPAIAELATHPLMKLVDVITPNQHEARSLVDADEARDLSSEEIGRRLIELGPRAAIITEGAAGAMLIDDKTTHIPGVVANAIDTTAAGDAFNGAIAVALAESRSLVQAVEFANRAAAISVERLGAQPSLPTREEVGG